MYDLLYVHRRKRVTDAGMLMLQLSEDRYQDILRKCTSKVISAERQVSITQTLCLSYPLSAVVCPVQIRLESNWVDIHLLSCLHSDMSDSYMKRA